MKRILALSVAIITLGGCASTSQPPVEANDPSFAPVVPDYPRETIVEDGSLFRSYMANSLYSDVTARRVGDIITVTLSESTSASKSADTTTAKDSSVNLDTITGLGGQAVNIGGQSIQLGIGSSSDFSGDSAANQSNKIGRAHV